MKSQSLYENYWVTTVLAIVIGIFVAGLSVAFILALQFSEKLLYVQASQASLSNSFTQWHWWLFVIMPGGGLIVGLLSYYMMPGRKNVGLAGVIEATHENKGIIKFREGIGVALVSAVSIGTGASVGRYGPAVHLGASAGSWLAQLFKLSRESRLILLGCGVAAAVAASFNAPFAGVIFAHEFIIRNYSIRTFAPVAIASTAGVIVGRLFNPVSMFSGFEFTPVTSLSDYGVAIIIAIACAFVGIAFLKTLLFSLSIGSKVPVHPIIKPVIGGLLLATIAMVLPQTLGLGVHVVNNVIVMQYGLLMLLSILIAKILAISISFSFGFNGGVFGPALFLGATVAGIIMTILQQVGFQSEAINTMMLIGAGCLISVVFGAPIATTIVILELSNSYAVTSAVLIGVVITRLIANRTFGKSYLDFMINKKGINLAISREKELMSGETIGSMVRKVFISLDKNSPASNLKEAILKCDGKQELFITEQGKLVGMVRAVDLLRAGDEISIDKVMTTVECALSLETSIDEAMQKIQNFSGLAVPVLNTQGVLVGVISEAEIALAYRRISQQIQHEQQA